MWAGRCVRVLAIACALLCSAAVHAASGDKAFVDGNTLLAKGDLRGALKLYAAAAQADRANQQYSQKYLLVRQVVMLQDRLADETDGTQRVQMCQALRAFYASQGLHDRALPIDQELFARLKTASSAIQLAETHLALDQQEAAAKVLSGLESNKSTEATQAMLSLALARQGKMDDARRIAASIAPAADAGPGTLYVFARMQAAVGEGQAAASTLRRCFESMPPSRLADLKSHAKGCVDFASLAATAGFQDVLQTSSKVAESACSGGSSCANCPMRGGCPGSRGQ